MMTIRYHGNGLQISIGDCHPVHVPIRPTSALLATVEHYWFGNSPKHKEYRCAFCQAIKKEQRKK